MVAKELQNRILAATGNAGYKPPPFSASYPVINVEALGSFTGGATTLPSSWTGEKFLGGFGLTRDYEIADYWLLRKRSKQLFTENLYARGLLRRLLTNEVHKGLALEATPDGTILGIDHEVLADWSERTERRFSVWGAHPGLCDYRGLQTFGALTRQARLMALVSGDVLVLLRQNSLGLPNVELVDADSVTTPLSDTMVRAAKNRGNEIKDGVEIDPTGHHVAFFVKQQNGTWRRVPAYGPRTGRLQAWLYYGTEKLIEEVRGQSLLGLVMQSLKEMDRGRDAELRAMVVNSMIAMWIEKTEDKMGTLPLSGGAVRRDTVTTQNDSEARKDVTFSHLLPGLVMQEMQTGEKPTSYDTRRPNVNFGVFENAVLSAIAWANEIPPETLMLQFQNNYSASRGATNEFRLYLDKVRHIIGESFCSPIYQDWLLSEVLNRSIEAPGMLESWRDSRQWDVLGAWTMADWAGAIKPNVDLLKEVNAYRGLVGEGWITRDRASRELTGMKYSKVVQQLGKENRQLAESLEPLLDAGLIKDENPDRVSDEDMGPEETDQEDEDMING